MSNLADEEARGEHTAIRDDLPTGHEDYNPADWTHGTDQMTDAEFQAWREDRAETQAKEDMRARLRGEREDR